jgi:hypothetical protein
MTREERKLYDDITEYIREYDNLAWLASVTAHGVWRGKDGLDWQHERIDLDARSPALKTALETDLSIAESYDDLVE